MKKLNFLIKIFIVFNLFSCENALDKVKINKDSNGYFIKENFYTNGQLKTSFSFRVKDSIQEGPAFWYYENGQLNAKTSFKDGNQHGKLESYYPNGQLEQISYWDNGKAVDNTWDYFENGQLKNLRIKKDGKTHGLFLECYESGKLMTKGYKKEGLFIGPVYTYYESGSIKQYTYFDTLDYYEVFKLTYSEDGNELEKEGTFILNYIVDERGELKVGEELEIIIQVATPPDLELDLHLGILADGGKDIEEKVRHRAKICEGVYLFKKSFIKQGYYKYALRIDAKSNIIGESKVSILRGHDWVVNVW